MAKGKSKGKKLFGKSVKLVRAIGSSVKKAFRGVKLSSKKLISNAKKSTVGKKVGLAMMACIPFSGWGPMGHAMATAKRALAKQKGKDKKKGKEKLTLKELLELLLLEDRVGRMYTSARQVLSDKRNKLLAKLLKPMMLMAMPNTKSIHDVQTTHKELRTIADLVYTGGKYEKTINSLDENNNEDKIDIDIFKNKWKKKLRKQIKNGLGNYWGVREVFTSESGLEAMAFLNHKTNELVVAFRGTELSSMEDILADVQIVMQLNVNQKKDADIFIKDIKKRYDKKYSIIITGHSLGGFHAQDQAAKTGYPAATFNAVGMKPKPFRHGELDVKSIQNPNMNIVDDVKNIIGKYDQQIVNFVDSKDLIGNYGQHLGTVITTEEGKEPTKKNELNIFIHKEDAIPSKLIDLGLQVQRKFEHHDLSRFDDHFDEDGMINIPK